MSLVTTQGESLSLPVTSLSGQQQPAVPLSAQEAYSGSTSSTTGGSYDRANAPVLNNYTFWSMYRSNDDRIAEHLNLFPRSAASFDLVDNLWSLLYEVKYPVSLT